tara:strand:+ start:117 stop:1169 length:1053 start_codon:yes stop_codon:yes gene_type:complete
MSSPFIQISDALHYHPVIQNLKGDHYKIFDKFLRLLNFKEQIQDAHGTWVQIKPGEILTTYRDLEIKLDTTKRVLLRLFDKLKKTGIITQRGSGLGKKRYLEKSIFTLEEKYRVIHKAVPTNEKTVPGFLDDLPRENEQVDEKAVPQIYIPILPYTSSINVCDMDATARAHSLSKSSQPPDTPKELHQLHPIHKNGRGRKESKLEKEEVDGFLLWAESYGFTNEKAFERPTVLRWIRKKGLSKLSAVFNSMLSEHRKMAIRTPAAWITTGLDKDFPGQEEFIHENKNWLIEYMKKNHINFIEIKPLYCKFVGICYNEHVYYNIPDFKKIIINRIEMLKERTQKEDRYGTY